MLDKKKLGFEIKKWRKQRKLTQNQLASDICNQSEISRIEKGDFFPSLEVLYLISNKLHVPISLFFEALNHEELEEVRIIKSKVHYYSKNKKYEELYRYIEKLLQEKIYFHPDTEKFLKWQNFVAQYYLKKIDAHYCLAELYLILNKETIGMDREINLHIKISMANIFAELKKYNRSMEIYNEILMEQLNTVEAKKLKIKASYNYGKLLYLKKAYQHSLEVTDNGIELANSNADMALLGQFYYQKGAVMEELNLPFEDIAENYKKALFFFELLEMDVYKNILLEKKRAFVGSP